MNNSTSTNGIVITTSLGYFYQLISFGAVVLLLNVIIIIVLLRNKGLLKKSAFIFGLAVADCVEGLALISNGITKTLRTLDGTGAILVHPFVCMKEPTALLLLCIQLPGVMFFMIGVERFLAIHFFDWYYKKWNNKTNWLCTLAGYIFCSISMVTAYLIAYLQPAASRTPLACNAIKVVGNYYSFINYCISIGGGTVAVVATCVALLEYKAKKFIIGGSSSSTATMRFHIQKQLRLTIVMFIVAILDLFLVVVPNIILMLVGVFNVSFENQAALSSWSFFIISIRSSLNLFMYLFVNQDFRMAAKRCISKKNTNSVSLVIFSREATKTTKTTQI